jgi:o-succinylbenzoate synthase
MKATYQRYLLNFKRPSGTSRGVLTEKETWFLKLTDNGKTGYGECGILRGLSVDDRPDFETTLMWLCENIDAGEAYLKNRLQEFPSIVFGLEMALKSLKSKNKFELFPSDFTKGKASIPINGLIWMGEKQFMKQQIQDKIDQGFSCIKLKIGAIDFEREIELLNYIRTQFSADKVELRVDANGAFQPKNALEKLKRLSELNLHSIEQPIAANQWEEMAGLCAKTPLPIALDEELIGVFDRKTKEDLLKTIKPQYIILKPSLVGGIDASQEWIDLAEGQNVKWWITSALESNIGLNALAQWTFNLNCTMPQGLGTGSLFTNNIPSPLEVKGEFLNYSPNKKWQTDNLI